MNQIEDQLRTVLAEHADHAPRPAMLLGAVHGRSRRQADHRRTAMAGGAALAVAVAVAAPALVFSRGNASPPAAVAAGNPAPVTNTAAPAPAGPLTIAFRVSAVPAGWFPQLWPSVEAGVGTVRLESPDPAVWATVAVYDPANGVPAHLGPLEGEQTLAVDKDATHRVFVFGPGLTGAQLHQIASGVDVHASTPVVFPWKFGYLPAGMRATAGYAEAGHVGVDGDAAGDSGLPQTYDPPAMNAGITLRDRASRSDEDYGISVGLNYKPADDAHATAKYGTPDTMFAGHRARVEVGTDGTVQVVLYDAFRGEVVSLYAAKRIGRAELAKVVGNMSFVPRLTAFGSWYANPLP